MAQVENAGALTCTAPPLEAASPSTTHRPAARLRLSFRLGAAGGAGGGSSDSPATFDAETTGGAPLTFTYHAPPQVWSIEPAVGPVEARPHTWRTPTPCTFH